ncbi:MAG: hypothetical protein OK457_00495 [Thaumarchaeota archaeon]|nr:hypothetical protein [Nitrososphaerota archaeon]
MTAYQRWVLEKLAIVQAQKALDKEHAVKQAALNKRWKELVANEPPKDPPKTLKRKR